MQLLQYKLSPVKEILIIMASPLSCFYYTLTTMTHVHTIIMHMQPDKLHVASIVHVFYV